MSAAGRTAAAAPAPRLRRSLAHVARHSAHRQQAHVPSAHEHQAQQRGAQFARGLGGLSRGLLVTPAAGFVLPSSTGEPLPAGLRETLEWAFDARLGAVRVHRDAPARAAAQALGARAFASGVDLYFAGNAYDPWSDGGRALIAHELTHVLQQTGTRGADGVLTAMPRFGLGALQFARDFDGLRALHGGAQSGAAYQERAEEIKAAKVDEATLSAYAEQHLNELATWPGGAVNLLYDVCKRQKLYELAVRLIERDNYKGGVSIRTGFYTPEVVAKLIERSSGTWVFERAINANPDLLLYRSELVRLIEGFLFQRAMDRPTALVRNMDPAAGAKSTKWEKIGDHLETLRLAYAAAPEPLANEWYYHALAELNSLDQVRVIRAQQERDAAATWSTDESLRRWHRLASVRRLAEAFRNVTYSNDKGGADTVRVEGWRPFHDKLADAVAAVTDKVQKQWDALDLLEAQMRDPKAKGAPPASQLDAIASLATSSGLSTRLVQAITALNATQKGGARQPAPDDYFSLCLNRGQAIDKVLRDQVDARLQGWHRTGKTDKVVAGLWLIANVWPVRDLVLWEQPPFGVHVTTLTTVTMIAPTPALVTAHRIATARALAYLAPLLRSTELAARAKAVNEAELETESQLALLPDADGVLWRQDVASKDRVMTDFSDVPLRGARPVTPYGWLLLYEADYLERMKVELDLQLPAGEAGEKRLVGQGVQPSIAGTASKTVRAAMQAAGMTPQRWTVPDDRAHVYFAQKTGGQAFADLLFEQARTEAFYRDATALGLTPIAPLADDGRAFMWFWPQYPGLQKLLRGIGLYNELVAMARFDAKDAAALEATRGLDDATWTDVLEQVMQVKLDPDKAATTRFTAQELAAVVAAVTAFFTRLRDGKVAALESDFQAASRIDRMRWAEQARVQLARYAADHHLLGVRDTLFEQLQRFYLSLLVVFRDDARPVSASGAAAEIQVVTDARPRLHLGALMLEIAPAMETAFEYERSGYFVAAHLGMLEDGLASAGVLAGFDASLRKTYLHGDENGDVWLKTRLDALSRVVLHLQSVRRAQQLDAGFAASVKDQTLDVQMRFSSPLPQGTSIFPRSGYGVLGAELTGKYYRFLGVHRDFIYHPAFGSDQPQTMHSTRSGYGAPLLFEIDNKTPLSLSPGEPLLSIEETDAQGNVLRPAFDVGGTKADYALLAEIYSGALYWAFGSSMRNIQEGIERYVSTLADLAELIPGWGTAITAARVVGAIGEFWAEGTYEDMLRVINGDTREMLEGLYNKLAELADPGALVELLLFGNPTLNSVLASSTLVAAAKSDAAIERKPPEMRGKFGALKKTFAALKALGRRFAKALEGLHERVQQPMQDARIYTSTRPALSMALQFGVSHIYELQELAIQGAAIFAMVDDKERSGDPSLVDKFSKLLGDEQADLGEKIHAIVGRLATLELPQTIVDVTGAVQFILAEMMAFVGKRLGLQGKVVIIILQGSGALDYFAGKVAREIVARGFDPNVYWRDDVIPLISGRFNAARDSLVKDLNDLLAQPAFNGAFTHIGKADLIALAPDASITYPDADAQPAPAADRELDPHPRRVPQAAGGTPLDPAARGEFEPAFGSDLGHVRMHTGSEGEAMTSAFGADALASGSHVFMRQSLDPGHGRGQEVMHHELAHVVQQTGPRRLGQAHADAPQPAHPERGLLVDPASETEAHRMADEVRARMGGGGTPSGVAARAVAGMQPYTLETLDPYLLARSLRALNRLSEIKAQEQKFEHDKTPAKLDRSDDGSAVNAFVKAFTSVTPKGATPVVKAPKVFQGRVDKSNSGSAATLDRIFGEIKRINADELAVVASHIAKEAQDLIPQVKVPGSKKPVAQARYVNPSHFARQFEGYVLGKTGVALALRVKTREFVAPDGTKLHEIDPTAPLAAIEVMHLYLPYIDANTELARFAITNTWPDARTDDKRRAKLSATVRGELQGKGIRAAVWALFGDTYQFSIIFKREIDNAMSSSVTLGGALDPDLLPEPDDYADADLDAKQTSRIGTRVATYAAPNQQATGRHSHHLTQFLVGEYFANQNDGKKPFKANAKLPGVTWSGGVVTHISPDPSAPDKGIKAGETHGGSSRGGAMPAISLAASTHMAGDLHITAQPDDLGLSKKSTQAYAVDRTFRSSLPDALKPENYASQFATWRKTRTDADIAQLIHGRAQATFRLWAKHMNDRLEASVPPMELAYYKALAAGNTKAASVKAVATDTTAQNKLLARLKAAASTAVDHNYKVMATLGWTRS